MLKISLQVMVLISVIGSCAPLIYKYPKQVQRENDLTRVIGAPLLGEGTKLYECGLNSNFVSYVTERFGKPRVYQMYTFNDIRTNEVTEVLRYEWHQDLSIETNYIKEKDQEVIKKFSIRNMDKELYDQINTEIRKRIDIEKDAALKDGLDNRDFGEQMEGRIEVGFGEGFEPGYNITLEKEHVTAIECIVELDME